MELQRARMLRDKQQKLQRASEAAAANPYSPKGFAERIQRDADVAGEQAKQIEDFNADRSKQQYGADLESQKEDLKLKLARSDKLKGGIEAASRQFEGGDRDTLRLARSALNDPAMWTGAGAEREPRSEQSARDLGQYQKARNCRKCLIRSPRLVFSAISMPSAIRWSRPAAEA